MTSEAYIPAGRVEAERQAARAMLAALKATHIAWGNNMERHAMDGDDTWTDEDHAEWQEGSRVIDAAIAQAEKAGITTAPVDR